MRNSFIKAFRIMLVCSVPAIAWSCKDALEPQVFGALTPETFFSSEADFKNALIALYAPFSADWGSTDQGVGTWYAALYNADPKTYWARSETTTDEMFSPWDPTFTGFTWGPATFAGGQAPDYAKIRYVARATDVIDKIQQSKANVPDAVKAQYVAEAKALRGWLMFILYDFFGPVNAKTDPATLSSTEITPRPSQQEYVAQMVKDLTEAIPDLKDRYNGDATNWGRIGKGTARMVLLRLYMHDKDWVKAEAVAREITQMGYSLVANYTDICSALNNEQIYAVPTNASSPNWYFQEVTPGDFASAGTITRDAGWYGYWMPWSHYDTYSPTDKRLATVIASYTTTSGGTMDRARGLAGAIPMKCTSGLGGSTGSEVDWPVFRYAETLLSLAEAINEQARTAEALPFVNQVRTRAGVPTWAGLSQVQLRDSLMAERGRELYAEGVRRDDLIRAGTFISSALARGAAAKPGNVLFPIPLEVIQQSNGIITQNPGY
jgi:hypothetical protein